MSTASERIRLRRELNEAVREAQWLIDHPFAGHDSEAHALADRIDALNAELMATLPPETARRLGELLSVI